MDVFYVIQQFLARSFGFALDLPGQLVLSGKEQLGIPTGLILKKYFELFGINFSLDVEILLKKGIHFELSASRDYRIFGIDITPSFSVGKYGVSASLEVGANNYYANLGVGFDRVPGFSIGLRRGTTGFDFSFGGGFADELQFFSGYKTFTVPLGIDFRGNDKEFKQIPEYSGFGAIEYRDNGAGVLVPTDSRMLAVNSGGLFLPSSNPLALLSTSRTPQSEVSPVDWRQNVNIGSGSIRIKNNAVMSGRSVRDLSPDSDSPYFSKNPDEVTFYKSVNQRFIESILTGGLVSYVGSSDATYQSLVMDLRRVYGLKNPAYGVIDRVTNRRVYDRIVRPLYGDTIIQLKSSVLNDDDSLTYTVGDSFSMYTASWRDNFDFSDTFVPKPFSQFRVSELTKVRPFGREVFDTTRFVYNPVSYIEGQFDRKLVSDDIASIIFTGPVTSTDRSVILANMLGIKTYRQDISTGVVSRLYPRGVPSKFAARMDGFKLSAVVEVRFSSDFDNFIGSLNTKNSGSSYIDFFRSSFGNPFIDQDSSSFSAHVLASSNITGLLHSEVSGSHSRPDVKIELSESFLRREGLSVTLDPLGMKFSPQHLQIFDLQNAQNYSRPTLLPPSDPTADSVDDAPRPLGMTPRFESSQNYYALGEFSRRVLPEDIASVTFLTRMPSGAELAAFRSQGIPVYESVFNPKDDFRAAFNKAASGAVFSRVTVDPGDGRKNISMETIRIGITPAGLAIRSEVATQNRTSDIMGRLRLSGVAARFLSVDPIRR